MAMMRVKICGITTHEDATSAVRLGADGLGFLVGLDYESEDELKAKEAGELIATLPPFVMGTLVTHRTDLAEVRVLCRISHPQALQLHAEFALERIPKLREEFPWLKIIKAIQVEGELAMRLAQRAAQYVDAVLLDTKVGTRIGGTGVTHDWSISRSIRDALLGTPVILAGGLTPGNVGSAIGLVRPYAVDVNSGVSIRRGKKSSLLMEEFIRTAKHTTMETVSTS
jgi:phosphoribosylanthranilate isomerase